jgi:hypothetical protein
MELVGMKEWSARKQCEAVFGASDKISARRTIEPGSPDGMALIALPASMMERAASRKTSLLMQ